MTTLTDPKTSPVADRSRRGRIGRIAVALVAFSIAVPAAIVSPPATTNAVAAASAEPLYGAPDAIAGQYYGALLRHTRWAETVWDSTAGVYKFADFNFAVVLGNAVLIKHGDYDAQVTGVTREVLKQKTVATIKHYAALNRFVNPSGTWGKKLFWDSTFQSYFLAAGKLMWADLDEPTRTNLTTIATGQSKYTSDLNYGDDPLSGSWTADWPTGKFDGDTAQEEAGVYTQALAPGLAWAPNDADANRWAEQLGDWGRNAAGQPTADKNNPAIVAGKSISSNTLHTIRDSYLVENHGSFGPHYQSDIWRSGARNAIHFLINDQPVPEILTRQPNSAELWESIKLVMSDQGEPFMPMVADREYLYGRDVLPIAFLGQVLRDPDAVRAEANLAAALEDYQAYAPVDRLTKFSGEPKYEPEARAEIAISYLLHVEAAESDEGIVQATPQDEFFARLSGTRDFGTEAGLTVQQSELAWAAASSRKGFVKFPWVPTHNSWTFDVSGSTPFLYPRPNAVVDTRNTTRYTAPGDGFDGTSSLFTIGEERVGQVTLPTGSAIYASSGAGRGDASLTVRNLEMNGYAGLDGSRVYTSGDGAVTATRPAVRAGDVRDASAARIDTLNFAPVDARYVRMQGVRGNASFGYSMHKFHVYGPDERSAVDLAQGRTATASSQDAGGGRTAARVTDNVASNRWAVAAADRTRGDSWIQVDLGSAQQVGGVRLAWESSAGSRYLVQTSTNGTDWTTQTTYGSVNAADANVARLDTVELVPAGQTAAAPVEARYVRMQGVQGNPQYGYSLYHFRAFTPEGVDAAAGKPATASSNEASRTPASVTDGSATTRWAVSNADRPRSDSWIQVDLGAPTSIAKVQLGWEASAGKEYRIQVSADGQSWTDAAGFRFTGDQVLSTDSGWLNVDGAAGFVVRGSTAPITVSRESEDAHTVTLADAAGAATSPFLVEMLPADAQGTSARAATAATVVDTAGVIASSLDGYLSVFNLTGAAAEVKVTVPHRGASVGLFDGTQVLDAQSSIISVTVPASSATVLAPRFTLPKASIGDNVITAKVRDGRSVELTGNVSASIELRNVETDERRDVELAEGVATSVRIADASAFPVGDLALLANAFPASVLPAGMTSPARALDGDSSTAWKPGTDGRMVVDLGTPRSVGTVAMLWDGADVPDAVVSVSDDGIAFREVATVGGRGTTRVVPVDATVRYIALSTGWSTGDAALTSLRVLKPGVAQDLPAGDIEGDEPEWQVGRTLTEKLTATGSPAPEFSVTAGALPAGVTLDSSGTFGGAPTAAEDFTFTVTAANGIGDASTRTFTGEVAPLGLTVTASPAAPNGDNGWFVGDVVLTATSEGTDLTGRLQVNVDDAGWATVSTPVTVTGDGAHTVRFRVVGSSGQTLSEADWSGRIDANTPVSSAAVDDAARTITVRSADATSGLARIEVRVGDGDWTTYGGPITVGAQLTVVQFRGVDKAGNVETFGQAVVPKAGVTLVDSLTAAILTAESIRYYDASSVTVRVSGSGATPTGTVAVVSAGVEVGTATLVDGRARITLDPKLVTPGVHNLQVVYSGDARFATSSDTVRLTVAKAAVTVKATMVKSTIKRTQTPQIKVVVTSKAPITGKVSVMIGTSTKKANVMLVNGRATISLPKIKKGSYKLVVVYSGTDTTATAKSAAVKLKVK